MDFAQILGLAAGSAWAAGTNAYLSIAVLGIVARMGVVTLPGHLDYCQHPAVIGLAVAFYLIEFVAHKVPWVDSIWDALHTFIRVPLGVLWPIGLLAIRDRWPKALPL